MIKFKRRESPDWKDFRNACKITTHDGKTHRFVSVSLHGAIVVTDGSFTDLIPFRKILAIHTI